MKLISAFVFLLASSKCIAHTISSDVDLDKLLEQVPLTKEDAEKFLRGRSLYDVSSWPGMSESLASREDETDRLLHSLLDPDDDSARMEAVDCLLGRPLRVAEDRPEEPIDAGDIY